MITATTYIKPNITIDSESVGSKRFYVHNYKGVHYRVFNSLTNLRDFIAEECKTWIFECDNENELGEYLYGSAEAQ